MNRNERLQSYMEKSIQHRKMWEAEWNRLNRMDLSILQTHLLSLLNKQGPLQSKDLVRQMSVTSGGVTMICDKLLSRGLIRRIRSDEQDRRAVYLEITDLGREETKTIDAVWEQVLANSFTTLTDAEIAMLEQIYSKLTANP
ncbi:MarR family winged helix-turn-helix transcriptional regulator [Paenibacillus nasutitermitis]|uniref:HTH marR-type domain-containing protein n=1 Tax=Paenibacillus nasutitermitis TaxID=1652958 RepID=A0A917E1Z0_9BACL|nr:MarR family transcriptional regulator [Paenibacillus nasutitermitis]GGD90978.1 hypothetical protein GCM10010911_57100 [Paenibacillus nasutitermitis]